MDVKPDQMKALSLRQDLIERDANVDPPPGWMFQGLTVYFDGLHQDDNNTKEADTDHLPDYRTKMASTTARFASAKIATKLQDETVTHVVVNADSDVKVIRQALKWYVTFCLIAVGLRNAGLWCRMLMMIIEPGVNPYRESSRRIGLRRVGGRERCWMRNVSCSILFNSLQLDAAEMIMLDGDEKLI